MHWSWGPLQVPHESPHTGSGPHCVLLQSGTQPLLALLALLALLELLLELLEPLLELLLELLEPLLELLLELPLPSPPCPELEPPCAMPTNKEPAMPDRERLFVDASRGTLR